MREDSTSYSLTRSKGESFPSSMWKSELAGVTELISEASLGRFFIEPSIAELASKNRTEEDVELLESNLEKMHNCFEESEILELDRQFHLLLAEATNVHFLPKVLEPLLYLSKAQEELDKYPDNVQKERILLEHKTILSYIKSQDSSSAINAMNSHLNCA